MANTGWQQGTYGCCNDPAGACFSVYCMPCMLCSIQPTLSSGKITFFCFVFFIVAGVVAGVVLLVLLLVFCCFIFFLLLFIPLTRHCVCLLVVNAPSLYFLLFLLLVLLAVPPNNVGSKGLPGVCPALCLGSCVCCAICCCRQNMVPCYLTTAIKAVRAHNPGLPPLGPCGDSEFCGAYCNTLCCFSAPCTACALYSEAKYMKNNGGGQAGGMVQVQPVVVGAPSDTEMTR